MCLHIVDPTDVFLRLDLLSQLDPAGITAASRPLAARSIGAARTLTEIDAIASWRLDTVNLYNKMGAEKWHGSHLSSS